MKVNYDAKDALKLTHDDKNFYFCSTMCMTKFTNAPETYKNNERCFFGLFPKRKSG